MMNEMLLLLLDFGLMYLAGLIYLPKYFLIPPVLMAGIFIFSVAAIVYALHLPLIIWAKIPYIGWPAQKFLDIEIGIVAIFMAISIGIPLLEQFKKLESEEN